MARNLRVHVEPAQDGRWTVRLDGMARSDSLHARKYDAECRAQDCAGHARAQLVVKDARGHVERTHDFAVDSSWSRDQRGRPRRA